MLLYLTRIHKLYIYIVTSKLQCVSVCVNNV
jgi:hypothetical protein